MAQHIADFCEDKARAGDGSFAIAFAILELARAQERTAAAIDRVGLADAATGMGAIEFLSGEVKRGAKVLAEAIESAGHD